MQIQLPDALVSRMTVAGGIDLLLISNRESCGQIVVNRALKEQCVGIDVMFGAEVEQGFVGQGVAPLHRGKGRGGDTEHNGDIFIVYLSRGTL